jgi:uncharacterized membrane protein
MKATTPDRLPHRVSIRPRLLRSLLCAGIVGIALPHWWHWATQILCIWDAFTISFLVQTWRLMVRTTPEMMRRYALKEDEGRLTILSIITASACLSIVAITFIPHDKDPLTPVFALHLGIAISTIIESWLLVHTIFTQHYAHLYYQGDKTLAERKSAGLDFPGELEPDYWDFLYFSFVIGMTSQVSDVDVTSRQMRQLSLLHGVVSFFFNTTLVAITINIVAGIIS